MKVSTLIQFLISMCEWVEGKKTQREITLTGNAMTNGRLNDHLKGAGHILELRRVLKTDEEQFATGFQITGGEEHLMVAKMVLEGKDGVRVEGLLKNSSDNHHHRVRRMLGRRTECVPTLKNFCSMFTYGKTTKRFCLTVTVKKCTALD